MLRGSSGPIWRNWASRANAGGWSEAFVDPPYGRDALLPALLHMAERGWLAHGGLLCAELEAGLELEEPVHPALTLLRDKSYGQTRILIWRKE